MPSRLNQFPDAYIKLCIGVVMLVGIIAVDRLWISPAACPKPQQVYKSDASISTKTQKNNEKVV